MMAIYRSMDMPVTTPLKQHHAPRDFSDRVAYGFTRFARFFADAFCARRYGHRAVVLETVAAVPGMVGGALQHLHSLRRMEGDRGWIRTLLDALQRNLAPRVRQRTEFVLQWRIITPEAPSPLKGNTQ